MTVQELAELLDELVEAGHGDRDLRFVYQPNYPLQDEVAGVYDPLEDPESELPEEESDLPVPCLYLVSGGQDREQPYGPSAAFEQVRG